MRFQRLHTHVGSKIVHPSSCVRCHFKLTFIVQAWLSLSLLWHFLLYRLFGHMWWGGIITIFLISQPMCTMSLKYLWNVHIPYVWQEVVFHIEHFRSILVCQTTSLFWYDKPQSYFAIQNYNLILAFQSTDPFCHIELQAHFGIWNYKHILAYQT